MPLLTAEKTLLQAIYDSSSVAIFLVDMTGHIVHANQRMADMFSCTMAQLIDSEYVSLVHPAEREAGRQKMLALMAQGIPSVNVERRYWRRDGSEFWGNLTGKALLDDAGKPVGLVGNIADIDQRKRAEWELEASQERFERLARTVPCVLYDYIIWPDGRRKFLYLNARCEEFFELAPEVILEDVNRFWNLVHPEDRQRLESEEERARRGSDLFAAEVRLTTPSGREKWIRLSSRANVLEPGESAVWSGFMLDITETKQLEVELRQLATTDALTGLSNRSHFLRQVEQEMGRFQRSPRSAGVLMLDLDYFKHINDTHGHATGDEVLRDFARRVKACLRSVDLFGRMGGEEFCILLPDTDLEGARVLGQRLCQEVAGTPAQVGGQSIAYTVSIGAAEFRPEDRHFEPILARADAALYQAKRYGRNQVAVL